MAKSKPSIDTCDESFVVVQLRKNVPALPWHVYASRDRLCYGAADQVISLHCDVKQA